MIQPLAWSWLFTLPGPVLTVLGAPRTHKQDMDDAAAELRR
jgi:hypothetical protein